jgi:dimethylargininase
MFSRFTHALVCPPARTFADGLTSVSLGAPDVARAQAQHAAYCDALARHGCRVEALAADEAHPDSTFVEDTALIVPGSGAILSRPGAVSRRGEVAAVGEHLANYFPGLPAIVAPGTIDMGDVCETEDHVFIGISHRTNLDGATQLSAWLTGIGKSSSTVDIRTTPGILHFKSGVSALRNKQLVVITEMAAHPAFAAYEVVPVPDGEAYAANCVLVNDVVFVAAGFPGTHAVLRKLGYTLEILEMSEFEKMDGGLSCLSLRF